MKPNILDDVKLLLPTDTRSHKRQDESSSLAFKVYVISTMTFLWTGYTLLVRHTRSTVEKENVIYFGRFLLNFLKFLALFRSNCCIYG